MKEFWKDIVGYEGIYQVSNLGRVKSLVTWCCNKYKKREKILKPALNTYGYPTVSLSKNKLRKNKTIHRLVAENFIPNPNNYSQVNHKDGVKTNNKINNLEWVTGSENILHSYKNGLREYPIGNKNHRYGKLGKEHNRSKAVLQYDKNNNFIAKYGSQREAERKTGIKQASIGCCCRKTQKTAGGYIWKFEKEEK